MSDPGQDARANAANPYVGPRPFRPDEHAYFFGREREARDLLSLVIAERMTLFYAQSGAGKSSLVNTRLIPELRKAGFVLLPVSRVSGALPNGVASVPNIYIFNLLLSLFADQQNLARLAEMSLSDCLANLASDDGEHFYLSAPSADPNPTSPQAVASSAPAGEVDASSLDSTPDSTPDYSTPAHVLIIDQFEELLTSHADRWPERADFFRQLDEALQRDPLLWVVLVMREDFVAGLDPYTNLLSDNLRIRYSMQRMGLAAAKQAIQQPARKHDRPFAADALTALVDNLSRIKVMGQSEALPGQYVEPVQLQVVCLQLWENLRQRPPGPITADDLHVAGDVDQALADYYEQSLRYVQERLPGLVSEAALRDWFSQRLITENGMRGLVNQGDSFTGGLPNQVVDLLDKERYLVRRESRAGGVWVELTHDRFVEPILTANREWTAANPNPLTAAMQAWLAAGRAPEKLLRGERLGEAQRYNDQFARQPVGDVEWNQANDYAKWVGGRLPTEAEWEKACRGTGGNIYPWDGDKAIPNLLNYFSSGLATWTDVGSYPPGANGLYDMAGNVWEWTADWYDYYSNLPSDNPKGPSQGNLKIMRGGSYYDSNEYNVRCTTRGAYSPDSIYYDRGFRVVSAGS